jgi:hypothetical protein
VSNGLVGKLTQTDGRPNDDCGPCRHQQAAIGRESQAPVAIEFVLDFLRQRLMRSVVPVIRVIGRKGRRERQQNQHDERDCGQLRHGVLTQPNEPVSAAGAVHARWLSKICARRFRT